ncbi:hypothetical protein DB32_002523 [Sandaracinus amylolyticus]|uniref:Uncharacterized protein n=1 Tax=Sandaracinus amylolyticus TaxID=927083 RepID=A0A0F6SEK9_9BACT|nr:hypothetical protein DB32_002523 [Sandaracinus amylolyticus]
MRTCARRPSEARSPGVRAGLAGSRSLGRGLREARSGPSRGSILYPNHGRSQVRDFVTVFAAPVRESA